MGENDVNNPGGMTALHLAAVNGDLPQVQHLLHAGADANVRNRDNQPALFNALELSMRDMTNPIQKSNKTAIFNLLWDTTDSVVAHGQDGEGNTVLHLMAIYGFDELIEQLNQSGNLANLMQTPNSARHYPIHVAILNGQQAVVRTLFDIDPAATYLGEKGRLALHYAVNTGSLEMVELCLQHHHAEIDVLDDEGMTPLVLAQRAGYNEIRDALLAKGADPNQVYETSMLR